VRTTEKTTSASRTDLRIGTHGSGWGAALLGIVLLLAVVAAGCGGRGDTASSGAATEVEDALYGLGTTQLIDCTSLGSVDVSGADRDVARCSFEEEESGDGSMRQRSGCFVVEDGRAVDVTRDVPESIDCVTSP
jgi:hypothetical protein